MARKTKKFVAALEKAIELGLSVQVNNRDSVYNVLMDNGYYWSSDKKNWSVDNTAQSVFEDHRGNPLPHVRVRVTAHHMLAEHYARQVSEALQAFGFNVSSISEGEPNEKGAGARVYLHSDYQEGVNS